MSFKIIKSKEYLHQKTEPVATLEEGQEIAAKLIKALDEIKNALGLSANQIGIPKSVSVVRVRKESPALILINPVIIEPSQERVVYVEGCLSLPGKQTKTIRHAKIKVQTLNHANPLPFGPDTEPLNNETVGQDYGVLECVCIQHEIDHLNGILMTDDGVRFDPPKQTVIKHGRNDKVVVEKQGETQYIKYKKALDLVKQGWKII